MFSLDILIFGTNNRQNRFILSEVLRKKTYKYTNVLRTSSLWKSVEKSDDDSGIYGI